MGHKSQRVNRETGRSMVEMLGTLAIMGVLSIGAIAGFNYAMNKHRANEILDEARKRAYTVMTQIQLGLKRSLSEYDRHNAFAGGTFRSEIVTDGLTGQFGLEVTGVLGRVCNNLKDTVSDKTIIRTIKVNNVDKGECNAEDNTLVLVYNNDMSQVDMVNDPSTPETLTCPTGTSAEGVGGYATTLADTGHTRCYCNAKDTVYDSSATPPCKEKGEEGCHSYKDCNKGEYCQFTLSNCNFGTGTMPLPTTGTCHDVTPCGLHNIGTTGWVMSNYGSGCKPDWFTAKDICESQGMHMPSLSDVECERYKGDDCPTTGTMYGTLTADGLVDDGFWVTDLYTDNSTSCRAWYVWFGDGYVDDSIRTFSQNFVCRP